jgi:hypothetical protein
MITRFTGLAPRALAIAAQLLLACACAQAHPGHGLLDHGAKHALTSPYHAGMLAAIGVGCWLVAHFAARRAVPRRLLRWAGATALLAAAALWTFGQ